MNRHLLPAWFFPTAFFLAMASTAPAQKMGSAPVALPGHPGSDSDSYNRVGVSTRSLVVYGNVTLANGAPPGQLVVVERVCGGLVQTGGFADSKGRFSFDLGILNHSLGAGGQIDNLSSAQLAAGSVSIEAMAKCIVRANLSGFHSETLSLAQAVTGQRTALGTIVLRPSGSEEAPSLSANDAAVPRNAKKDFEKGLDAAAKAKWQEAIDSFEHAAAGYPKYASAWLSLGRLQAGSGDMGGALQSCMRAIAADDKSAMPYIEAALLESQAGDWENTAVHSGKAIALAPDSFPRAYLLNATAYLNTREYGRAEMSSSQGLKLDGDHQFPDLEYIQGIALMGRKDNAGARAHLEAYLALAPSGTNAASARKTLAGLPAK